MKSRLPHVVVRALVIRDDEILLVKRANVHSPGTWSAPGGHLEYGESPAAAAVRETWEETRVRIGEPRFRGITNDVFDAAGVHYLTIWMEASFVAGEPCVAAPEEMSDVGWYRHDALPEPLFLSVRNLLDGETLSG